MHPLPTRIAFAASPAALGVAAPPVIVTVLVEYATVPFVPSKAASLMRILSTDAWLRELDVVTKLELKSLSVFAKLNDVNEVDVVGIVNVLVSTSKAPKLIDVKLDFVPAKENVPSISFNLGNE